MQNNKGKKYQQEQLQNCYETHEFWRTAEQLKLDETTGCHLVQSTPFQVK